MIPVKLMEDLCNADILQQQVCELEEEVDRLAGVKFSWLLIGGVGGLFWGMLSGWVLF